jgi:hypothetical protein
VTETRKMLLPDNSHEFDADFARLLEELGTGR